MHLVQIVLRANRITLACLTLLFATARPGIAAADLSTTARFSIPPQALSTAVVQFTEQSGVQVTSAAELMRGRRSAGVTGSYPATEALVHLLAGTRLGFDIVDRNTAVITSKDRAPAAPSPATVPDNAATRDSAARSEPSSAVEEIVVTASKRSERLIDVPQSVSVLSVDALAKSGATQFRDFADSVPGLSYQSSGPGFTQITLRGVTAGSDAGATVGVYIDDVPIGSSTTFARGGQTTLDAGLFDLERIEVLKGPQGTLYGATSVGGLLKYVAKTPDTSGVSGSLQTGFAGTENGDPTYNLAGMINAPLGSDKVALRASGFFTRDGGYIDNVTLGQQNINGSKIYGGRADLLIAPTDALKVRLTGFAQDIESEGFPYADFNLRGAPLTQSLESSRPVAEPFENRFRLASASVSYDTDLLSLASISSYQTTQTNFDLFTASTTASLRPSGVATATLVDDSGTDKLTQELRLASKGTAVLEWLVGGFYTHETSHFNQDLKLTDLAGQPLANTFLVILIPSKYEEYAAFGDLTWHFTEKFDVTGGMRYAHNSTEFAQTGTGSLARSAVTTQSDDDVVTYLANARYHFAERAVGYVRFATGYRPGGPNVLTLNPTTGLPNGPATFEADTLDSYEAGFRFQSNEDRFGLELSAYYIDWNNLIYNVSIGGFASRGNAPDGARVNGAELALYMRPVRGLKVESTVAFQDAKMNEAVPTGLRAAKGERLPSVPRFTAALNADYRASGGWQPNVGATVSYVDARNASYDASTSIPQYRLPSYTAVDLRTGLAFGAVDAQLYVRNLFDERGQIMTRFSSPVAGPITVSMLQPRTVGLNLLMHF